MSSLLYNSSSGRDWHSGSFSRESNIGKVHFFGGMGGIGNRGWPPCKLARRTRADRRCVFSQGIVAVLDRDLGPPAVPDNQLVPWGRRRTPHLQLFYYDGGMHTLYETVWVCLGCLQYFVRSLAPAEDDLYHCQHHLPDFVFLSFVRRLFSRDSKICFIRFEKSVVGNIEACRHWARRTTLHMIPPYVANGPSSSRLWELLDGGRMWRHSL